MSTVSASPLVMDKARLQTVCEMPQRPNRKCRKAGCPELTRNPAGYCPTHRAQAEEAQAVRRRAWSRASDQKRGTAHQRGYGIRWQRYRIAFLHKYPYCGDSPNAQRKGQFGCDSNSIVRAATEIDHILPRSTHPELFWDENNHQSLCHSCHIEKTKRDRRTSADGTPCT